MNKFVPDYNNILDAAKNIKPKRIPLYEHNIDVSVIEQIMDINFSHLLNDNEDDLDEYFKNYCNFFLAMGFDTVSYEALITSIMPGNGSLYGHKPGEITSREDFLKYPWDEIPTYFFEKYTKRFEALRNNMPKGMKAIGGPGNGIFECVQDIVGFTDLCYISVDDPDLYRDLFFKVGETNLKIWEEFLRRFGDIYCVCRFGDDLGFKNGVLISTDDIKELIIPQYKPIVDLIHLYDKPFLLHSCGCIFEVMEDLIAIGIDAKHSNEDQIAMFPEWVEKYGNRIGNFGGIDTDVVTSQTPQEIKAYVLDCLEKIKDGGGIAFGSGNSIPNYVPIENFLAMNSAVRQWREEN